MNLQCPYQNLISHVNGFSFPWDYLVHLQKCHVLNRQIAQRQVNEFFFCQKCIQVFERETERDLHTRSCTSTTFRLRDVNQGIRLGVQASQKLASIINFYSESFKVPQTEMQIEEQPVIMKMIKHSFMQDAPAPIQQRDQSNMRARTQLNIELGPLKVRLTSADYTILNTNYNSIKAINQIFDHQITNETLKKLLIKHGHKFSLELLDNSKVCQFTEAFFEAIYPNDDVYYSIKHPGQNIDTIWFIMNDQNYEFQALFQDTWCIFAISSERIVESSQAPKTHQQMEFEYISSYLEAQNKELNKINEQKKRLRWQIQEEQRVLEVYSDRFDKLAQQYSIYQAKVIKSQTDYFSKEIQLTETAQLKLNHGLSLLENLFLHENNKLTQEYLANQQSQTIKTISMKIMKEQQKKVQRLERKQQIIQQIQEQQEQIKNMESEIEAKKFMTIGKAGGKQLIDPSVCIECKKAPRSVIQNPCKHFLFCEPCYIGLLSRPFFYCPLADIGQCKQEKIEIYKIIHL